MEQYIPKAALVAEINKRIMDAPIDCYGHQRVWAYNDVKDILITLEVKEMSNIWRTISDRDVDLPKAGDVICFIKNGRVISGEYRLNKFYGKVNNGYDNPIEKGDKWCFLSDILNSVVEVKEVNLEKSISDWLFEGLPNEDELIDYIKETAKHFFELALSLKNS